jgi:hypothetical protein
LGFGLFYVSRSFNEKFTYLNNADEGLAIEFVEQIWDVNGALAIVGLTHNENENFIWSFSFRSPVWRWGGIGRLSNVESGASEINTLEFVPTSVPLPMRLSTGVFYRVNSKNSISADLHFYFPYNKNIHPHKVPVFQIDLKPVVNVHLGYEYFFNQGFGMRTGFYTNMSASRAIGEQISAINDKVHMFGGTAALVFSKESGELVLGAWAQGGQGRARSVDPTVTGPVPRSNYFYGGVIASSYRF